VPVGEGIFAVACTVARLGNRAIGDTDLSPLLASADFLMFKKILIANRGKIAPTRHAGLDPASTFFLHRSKRRWIPGQARDDD
jgi:hypothetical protein